MTYKLRNLVLGMSRRRSIILSIWLVLAFFSFHASVVKAASYSFSDNFNSLSPGNLAGQNGWTVGSEGTWTVEPGGADGGNIVAETDTSTIGGIGTYDYYEQYVANGLSTLTDQTLTADFNVPPPPTGYSAFGYLPQFWLRRTAAVGDAGGYLIFYLNGQWTIAEHTAGGAGAFTTLTSATSPISMTTSTWYTGVAQVINNSSGQPVISFYVYPQGGAMPAVPAVTYTDASDTFQSGYFGLGTVWWPLDFDNVKVTGMDTSALTITEPAKAVSAASTTATRAITNSSGNIFYIPYIQTGKTLTVAAAATSSYIPVGGGVEFILNQGLPSEQIMYSIGGNSPFSVSFSNLAKGTYTLDAYIVDANKDVQNGAPDHDQEIDIGIGDIITAIGDSITAGYPYHYGAVSNWLQAASSSDPISSDNRNYPQEDLFNSQYEVGSLVELNNLLSAYDGYPVFIMNEGVSSYKASDYITLMSSTEWTNRESSLSPDKWLINLGVNDADNGVPSSTYAANLQTITNDLENTFGATGSNIIIAKPTYIQSNATATALEASYLPQIDNLISQDGLSPGPNFFAYYQPYSSTLYYDTLHPNLAGYIEMGELWSLPLLSPQNSQLSQGGNTVTVSWDNLSSDNSQINGYKLMYGTSPTNYTTTIDVGNLLTANIAGLTGGQTYYFSVFGYYSDPTSTTINQTAKSSPVSLIVSPPSVPVAAGGGGSAYDVSINSGAETTATTTVKLSLYGTAAYTIEVSNTSTFSNATWIPYVTSMPWELASNSGNQTVFVKFKAVGGSIVGSAQSSINVNSFEASVLSPSSTSSMAVESNSPFSSTATSSIQSTSTLSNANCFLTSPVRVPQLTNPFSGNLSYGMTSGDVTKLQYFLEAENAGPAARRLAAIGTTDHFLALTKNALIELQKKACITPASGYFGPITRAYINKIIKP